MSRLAGGLALALLASPLAAGDSRVDVAAIAGGRLVRAIVRGVPLDSDGLWLLTAEDGDGPRKLWRLDLGKLEIEPLAVELPPEANALASAGEELFVGEPGRLYRLASAGAELVVESRRLDLNDLAAHGFLEPGRVAVPRLGTLTTYVPGADGRWTASAVHDLPVRAEREPTGLKLTTLPVTRLDASGGALPPDPSRGGRVLYAVGPEAHGDRRLRTVLIDPEDATTQEAWSWLPAPEEVWGSRYAWVNGRAVLIVTTVSSERMGIFAKQDLRVFSLQTGDRSRAGLGPALKAETVSYRWHFVGPQIADADADGLADLVVIQPSGLGGKKVFVEVYLGRGGAQFYPLPLRSEVPVDFPDRWHYGADVDGDGVPDLVTASQPDVLVFRGLADVKKKKVLDKKAYLRVSLALDRKMAWLLQAMAVRDVDGDGRAEILVRASGEGFGVLWVIDAE